MEQRVASTKAHQILCGFSSRLLEQSPHHLLLSGVIQNRSLLLEEPFSRMAREPSRELFRLLEEVAGGGAEGLKHFYAAVKRDYTYLFYMVGISHTSPYESVYRTDDRTMFGPTTLDVRRRYRVYGMQSSEEGRKPDDHISSELAFLELLCSLAARTADHRAALGAIEAVNSRDILGDIRSFLCDHVLVFAPLYFRNVQTQAQEPFYRLVASIAEATLIDMAVVYDAGPSERIHESDYLVRMR